MRTGGSRGSSVVRIKLSRAMMDELYRAALEASAGRAKDEEEPVSPEDFATECIESVLATRRLEKIAASY